MPNIFSIDNWDSGIDYEEHDIVRYQSNFYYCITPHTSTPAFNPMMWNGTYSNEFNVVKPLFFWTPDIGMGVDFSPSVSTLQFGDGWESRTSSNINNTLLVLDIKFEGISDKHARAISHFLFSKQGKQSFYFYPPDPYSEYKLFTCKNWKHTFVFVNNNSIQAVFNEVLA